MNVGVKRDQKNTVDILLLIPNFFFNWTTTQDPLLLPGTQTPEETWKNWEGWFVYLVTYNNLTTCTYQNVWLQTQCCMCKSSDTRRDDQHKVEVSCFKFSCILIILIFWTVKGFFSFPILLRTASFGFCIIWMRMNMYVLRSVVKVCLLFVNMAFVRITYFT